jgi:hypothetical protein
MHVCIFIACFTFYDFLSAKHVLSRTQFSNFLE